MTLEKLAYSVDEAAGLLGISRWSVYRLIDAGDLAKIPHLGRRVQVARVELERFASEGVKRSA